MTCESNDTVCVDVCACRYMHHFSIHNELILGEASGNPLKYWLDVLPVIVLIL